MPALGLLYRLMAKYILDLVFPYNLFSEEGIIRQLGGCKSGEEEGG